MPTAVFSPFRISGDNLEDSSRPAMGTERYYHVTDSKFVPLTESAYLKVASDIFKIQHQVADSFETFRVPSGVHDKESTFRSCENVHVN